MPGIDADALFEEMVDYARKAASLDNAAGYGVATNTLKYALSVLNPEKYGTRIGNSTGTAEGFILETGIRREGDPGFIPSGAIHNEQSETPGPGIHDQNADVEGGGQPRDMDFNEGPV